MTINDPIHTNDPMNTDDTRITQMLHEQAAAARPADRLADVLDGTQTAVVVSISDRRRSPWKIVAAVAGVAAVVAGLAMVLRPGTGAHQPGSGGAPAVQFETPQVKLAADHFWIDVDGVRYDPTGLKVDVHSDPGDATYTTLELVWQQHGVEMRTNVYFTADGAHWWATELRTYNGKTGAAADWVTFTGEHFRTAAGASFDGTFDETATENGVTSHLHIDGLTLQAFRPGSAGAAPAGSAPAGKSIGSVTATAAVPPVPSTTTG